VGPQDHVTGGVVSNDCIGMHCTVIEDVCESLEGGLGAVGLLGGKGAEGH